MRVRIGNPWALALLRFVVATAVYALAAWGTLGLQRASGGIASIWVANALILGFAVRRPPSALPALLAAVVLGVALSSVLTGRSFGFGLVAGLINTVEVGLAYALLYRCGLRPSAALEERDLLLFFLATIVLGPAACAMLGATLASVENALPWHELFLSWWMADAFGMFVILPIMWAYSPAEMRRVLVGRAAPTFWLGLAAAVAVALVALTHLTHPFVVVALPLLFLAVRTGVFGTGLGNLLVIAAVLVGVHLQQRGVLPVAPMARTGLAVQDVWLTACMSAVGPLLVAFTTGQRNAERRHALKLSERLQVIADHLPAYIAELGPDLRYRFANAKYEQWLGKPLDQVIGRHPVDVLGAEAAARLAPHMARALAGEPQRFGFDMPTGQHVEVHYEPLREGGFVLMGHDVTWRHEAERRFRHLLESAPDAMVVLDRATRRIVLVNEQVERTFGYAREDLLGQSLDRLLLQPERVGRDVVEVHLAAKAAGAGGHVLELIGRRRDGTAFPIEVVLSQLLGERSQLVAAIRDVSARRRTERDLHVERERAQVTLNSIGDAVITYDTARRITSLNPVAEALTGWTRAEAQGRPYDDVVRLHDPDTGAALRAGAAQAVEDAADTGLSAILRRRDDGEVYVDDSDSPILDSEGTIIGGVTVLRDISEAHAMRQRMTHLARHDYLTGLPNRVLLQDRLTQALSKIDQGVRGALLFVDLDLFKHINDSLGHHTGDRVLQEVARRLVELVRTDDTVSRQGGDEFVLLVRAADAKDAAHTAQQLIRAIERPIEVDGRALHISASVGIALFPDDSREFDTLIKQADTALYHAKQAGRGRCSHFTSAMSERADQRMRLETELRHGIDTGQLFLVYQPKVELPSRRIIGLEALVRWRNTEGHVVPPLSFIPIAEETGLIALIDEWVLREACRRAVAWQRAGLPRVSMAVNVSLARLEPERLIEHLQQVLAETGLAPELLEVEFTESQMLGQHARAMQLVEGIRGLGVRLAVDDFGTGYSSLSYLTNYRFDTIKVDRSFVEGLPADVERGAVVQAILGMARTLRCRVVAEGVETDAQAEALLALGCSEMQGYRFSRPLVEADIEPMLRAGAVPRPPEQHAA